MPLHPTLQSLTDQARQVAQEDRLAHDRKAARCAWARQIVADFKAAQARADAAWDRLIDEHPEEPDDDGQDEIHPPEQAEVDAILAQITAACDHDRWPKELYWSL
jgi:hypothetical protein